MKHLILFFSCLFLSVTFTQEIIVTNGEELTNQIQQESLIKPLGQDKTGFYLLREYGPISNSTIVIENYSPALKLLSTINIETASGTFNDSKLHRFTEMHDGVIYVFYVGWNKEQQENSFWVRRMQEDGTLDEGVLLETEYAERQLRSANYSIHFSPDGSKLLVLTQKPFKRKEMESIRLQVFETKNLSSLWKQDFTLNHESERGPVNEIAVNNDGTAYFFKEINVSYKEHYYQLITANKDFSKTTEVEVNDYAIGQKKLLINSSGDLLIGGIIVAEGRNATDWQGTWFFQANRSGDIVQNKMEPLQEDIWEIANSTRRSFKEGNFLEDFILKDVLLKSTGGIILLIEEQKSSRTTIGQNSPPTYEYSLSFGKAVFLSYDVEGNREWSSVIDKKQTEKTTAALPRFGSFAYQLKDDRLYIVWNYTDIHIDAPLQRFRYWIDRNNSKINIDNLFGKEAFYPTLLTVIDANGQFDYQDRTFNSLPLIDLQKSNSFSMAINPSIFFSTDKGMIIFSHMPEVEAKRYKLSLINY